MALTSWLAGPAQAAHHHRSQFRSARFERPNLPRVDLNSHSLAYLSALVQITQHRGPCGLISNVKNGRQRGVGVDSSPAATMARRGSCRPLQRRKLRLPNTSGRRCASRRGLGRLVEALPEACPKPHLSIPLPQLVGQGIRGGAQGSCY
jgi:hypothetical protein